MFIVQCLLYWLFRIFRAKLWHIRKTYSLQFALALNLQASTFLDDSSKNESCR